MTTDSGLHCRLRFIQPENYRLRTIYIYRLRNSDSAGLPIFALLSFSVVQSLKGFMKTGIPSAGLPPLDPLSLDNVEFSLGGANIEFRNVTMAGLSNHDIGDVTYDESKRQTYVNFAVIKIYT